MSYIQFDSYDNDTHSEDGLLTRDERSPWNRTHGEGTNNTPEHRAYSHAKSRCNNPNTPEFPNYGGRGIQFRFTSYQEFLNELGRRPSPAHSLDRIDNNGNYEPGNVRWATRREQSRNKRVTRRITYNESTKAATDWAAGLGGAPGLVTQRLAVGWCVECAVTIPCHKGGGYRGCTTCVHISEVK